MKQHESELLLLWGGWCIPCEKVSGDCCFMTQLLSAASIIKSSAVQNLHTDGPFDAVSTPDCVFEMEWFAATETTYTLTSQCRVSDIWVWKHLGKTVWRILVSLKSYNSLLIFLLCLMIQMMAKWWAVSHRWPCGVSRSLPFITATFKRGWKGRPG